jgi:putative acetyltransferase
LAVDGALPMMTDRDPAIVRAFLPDDFDDVVRQWHETDVASYPSVEAHQRHTLDDARVFFRDHVIASCSIWVAERSMRPVGVIAIEGQWIRQLAVFHAHRRRGVATALLAKARACSPQRLRLFTFQRNEIARAFYEKHGFAPVSMGVSPPPESEPDVEYEWVVA